VSYSFLSISGILLSFTCLILAIIISYFGKQKIHKIYALLNICVAIWGVGLYFIGNRNLSKDSALFWWKIAHIGGMLIPVTFFHTMLELCHIKKRRVLIFFYFQAFFFIFLTILGYIGWKLELLFNAFYYIKPSGIAYILATFLWFLAMLLGFAVLIRTYVKSSGVKKNQYKYLLLAMIMGFGGGASHFMPVYGIKIYPLSILIVFYVLISTYAILKYRLADIRVAITRTGIFVLVYTLVLGLPFAIAIKLRDYLIESLGPGWWMMPLFLMAALATLGPFIYIFLQNKAEARLLHEQRSYQESLKQASIGMTRIRNLHKLLDLITHIVTKNVRISYAAIYLYNRDTNKYTLQISRDKGRVPIPSVDMDNPLVSWITSKREPLIYEEIKRQMEDTGNEIFSLLEQNMTMLTASVIIPSFLEDRFIGFFVLGDKISGQIYTPEDLSVFQVLASQAALAIENAQFYDEAKDMQEQIAQAEKMATIGTMADGLSHQINNRFYALSLIAGDTIDSIKLTDTSKCSPEVQEMISEINHALQRIQANVIQGGTVVKDILKYSRKGDEGLESLTIDQILDNTLEMVQYKVNLAEIDIVRDYTKDTPRLKGNLIQLQEAFFNFIDNAYDAIVERREVLKEAGYRGTVTISAKPKENNLEIIIQDNGMGIKDANNNKVFTPFFTTKTSSRQKGTGLGLYVIRRIITDTHKGKITFESEYKVGTRFILELPLA
jgi:signal transduction histidine kinase